MDRRIQQWGACLALIGILSSTAVAAAPASRDLALSEAGQLRGQVYQGNGQTLASKTVSLLKHGEQKPVQVTTDAKGQFAIANVEPGLYHLVCDGHGGAVRVWKHELAPPKSHDAAMIVVGEVERGKFGNGFWSNPLWLTGLVAAAIAIPLALSDSSGS